MRLEAAIGIYLRSYSALTALVGTKVYPGEAPKSAKLPYIIYHKVSDVQSHTMGSTDTPYQRRFQFSCFSDSYDDTLDIEEQTINALKDYSGTMGGAGGVTVNRVMFEMSTDIYDDEYQQAGREADFTFWHE